MSWTPMTPATSNGPFPSARYNAEVIGNFTHLSSPPRCQARQDTVQSIATGAYVAVTFDGEDWDTMASHSTTTNASRITPTEAGLYRVDAAVAYTGAAGGTSRRAALALNGNRVNGMETITGPAGAGFTAVRTTGYVYCNGSTDFVQVLAWQDTGAALSTAVSGTLRSMLSVLWVATS